MSVGWHAGRSGRQGGHCAHGKVGVRCCHHGMGGGHGRTAPVASLWHGARFPTFHCQFHDYKINKLCLEQEKKERTVPDNQARGLVLGCAPHAVVGIVCELQDVGAAAIIRRSRRPTGGLMVATPGMIWETESSYDVLSCSPAVVACERTTSTWKKLGAGVRGWPCLLHHSIRQAWWLVRRDSGHVD